MIAIQQTNIFKCCQVGEEWDTLKVMFDLRTARTHRRLDYSTMLEVTECKIYSLYSAIYDPLCDIYVIFIYFC